MKTTLRQLARSVGRGSVTALVLLLASCSPEAELAETVRGSEQPGNQSAMPVDFDAYLQRTTSGSTRSGVYGDLTTDSLTKAPVSGTYLGLHNQAGFGVFGYYTDRALYEKSALPNFMYNQQVKYNADASVQRFEYTPLKFWPNEYSGAQAQDNDRVTFFAYAPYVSVNSTLGTPTDGVTTHGITQLSRRDDTGDPLVTYVVMPVAGYGVDLCWGTVPTGMNNWGPDDASVTLTEGLPWLNLTRAKTTADRVKFQFRHALVKLNVTVDAIVDDVEQNGKELDSNTRIFVRKISFTGCAVRGTLNLNNLTARTPRWMAEGGVGWLSHDEISVYDGRYDGREGASANSAETPTGLNPELVQSGLWDAAGSSPGVTATAKNIFMSPTGAAEAPLYVIPNGDALNVTIEYDIETKDSLIGLLSDGQTSGVSIPCRITKTKVIDELVAGNYYKLKVHLGMNSVKFDVKAVDWGTTPEDPDQPVDPDTNPDVIPVSDYNQWVTITAWTEHNFTQDVINTIQHVYEFNVNGIPINMIRVVGGSSVAESYYISQTPVDNATYTALSTQPISDALTGIGYSWAKVTSGSDYITQAVSQLGSKLLGDASGQRAVLKK